MTLNGDRNEQVAPFPHELADLVNHCTYRPFWQVWLSDEIRDTDPDGAVLSRGLTLSILVVGPDTYNVDRVIRVRHLFPVPPATFNQASWMRWLFERFRDVESHEAMEHFQVDGARPYVPNHGPGHDVYVVREQGDALDAATTFRGQIRGATGEIGTARVREDGRDVIYVSIHLPDGRRADVPIDADDMAAVSAPRTTT